MPQICKTTDSCDGVGCINCVSASDSKIVLNHEDTEL
jgi:hypothetical protein